MTPCTPRANGRSPAPAENQFDRCAFGRKRFRVRLETQFIAAVGIPKILTEANLTFAYSRGRFYRLLSFKLQTFQVSHTSGIWCW